MHMRQVVAYKRLKMMENYKPSGQKVFTITYDRWSHMAVRLYYWEAIPLPPPLEKHINCSICCLVLYL